MEVILNLFQNLPYGLLSKRSYWKVCRRGAFQYLFLVFITTDPGLRLSRMTTTTNDPRCRSRTKFRMTAFFNSPRTLRVANPTHQKAGTQQKAFRLSLTNS